VSGQLHDSATISPGKEPRYLLDRRLGGPQSRSGALYLGVKRPGREADHSPPSSAEIKE
jgi:hypothetical protein